jgi:hypothetical protein
MADDQDDKRTYSIALRLRRTIHEDAYVRVPVSTKTAKPNDKGQYSLDWEALVAEAIRISGHPTVDWQMESEETAPHPIQRPMPDDRTAVDGIHLPDPDPNDPPQYLQLGKADPPPKAN